MRSHQIMKISPNNQIIQRFSYAPVEKTKVTIVKKQPIYEDTSNGKQKIKLDEKQQKKTHIYYGKLIEPLNKQLDENKKHTESLEQHIKFSNVKRINLKNSKFDEQQYQNIQQYKDKQNYSDLNNYPNKKNHPPDIRITISFEPDEENIPIPENQKIMYKKSAKNNIFEKNNNGIMIGQSSIEKQIEKKTEESKNNLQRTMAQKLKTNSIDQQKIVIKQYQQGKNISNHKSNADLKNRGDNQSNQKQSILLKQFSIMEQKINGDQINLSQQKQKHGKQRLNLIQQQFSYGRQSHKQKFKQIQPNINNVSRKGSQLLQIEATTYPRCLPDLYCKHS